MGFLKYLAYFLGAITLIAMVLFVYYGGLKSVKALKVESREMYVAYKIHKGDYNQSYKTMKETEEFLEAEMGISGLTGVGIYFDAPGSVDTGSQRSAVGYILTEQQYEALPENGKGVNKAYLPAFEAVYASFPYKGAPSFMFAVEKIYSAFDKYISQNSLTPNACIEVYNMNNKVIEIYMPLDLPYGELEAAFGV